MAISWDVTVSEKGKGSGNFIVSATVTDDSKPVKDQIETPSVEGRMDNQQQKEGLFDALKQNYDDLVGKTDTTTALEAEAKTYLEK